LFYMIVVVGFIWLMSSIPKHVSVYKRRSKAKRAMARLKNSLIW
jgi:hypothetical protein